MEKKYAENYDEEIIGKKVVRMGMELDRWTYKSCTAHFGLGEDWATLYDISSKDSGKGHATKLLSSAKDYYMGKGLRFGGSVALNNTIKHIYKKLDIKEYE
jgi:hypothetical protein